MLKNAEKCYIVLVSASRSLWLFAFSWASPSPLLALRSLSVRVGFRIRGFLVARSQLSFVSSQLLFLDDQWIHICSHPSAISISIVTSQIHNWQTLKLSKEISKCKLPVFNRPPIAAYENMGKWIYEMPQSMLFCMVVLFSQSCRCGSGLRFPFRSFMFSIFCSDFWVVFSLCALFTFGLLNLGCKKNCEDFAKNWWDFDKIFWK